MKIRAAVLEEFGSPLVVGTSSSPSPGRKRCSSAWWPAVCATPTCTRPPASTRPATRPPSSATRARASSSAAATDVTLLSEGDHVVTLFSPQCGECVHCLSPLTNLCLAIREQQNLGYLPDGTTRLSRDGEPMRHFMGTSTFARVHRDAGDRARARSTRRRRSTAPACSPAASRPVSGAAIKTAAVRAGLDLRRVRRRDGRPRRRRRGAAPGGRADHLRGPGARAAGARPRPGRHRPARRAARTPSRRSSR